MQGGKEGQRRADRNVYATESGPPEGVPYEVRRRCHPSRVALQRRGQSGRPKGGPYGKRL
jgi:hypothetical protein